MMNLVTNSKTKTLNQPITDKSNLNRCISGLYSPGSTYKLITALFVIEKMGWILIENFIVRACGI